MLPDCDHAEGWAFKRARACEATLAPEEVTDALAEGVDVRAIWNAEASARSFTVSSAWWCMGMGFAKFNGHWFVPLTRTAVASGLDPATHPGEFIALNDAECASLERVREHWRVQAEVGR